MAKTNKTSWTVSMSEQQRALTALALAHFAQSLGVANLKPEYCGTDLDELVILRDLYSDLPHGGSDDSDSREMVYGFNL